MLVALVLAAIAGASTFAELLGAYALAWVAVNVAVARGLALPRLDRRRTAALAVAIAAAPVVTLAGRVDAIAGAESLLGLDVNVGDRLRLERDVALHPALVRGDRPQLFFVRADRAREVRVTLAPGLAPIDAERLGHGVFRVEYDPRREGVPSQRGPAVARIDADGAITAREVEVVLPLAHPGWLRTSPDRRLACTTSEETDELVVVDAEGLLARVPTEDAPSDCAFLADGRIAVSHRHARALSVHAVAAQAPIQPETIALERAFGHRLAASADGARVAIAHESGRVTIVDVASRRAIARANVGGLADWIVWDGDVVVVARRAPAALVRLAIRGTSLRVERTRDLLAPATTLTRAPDGALILATTDWSDERTTPPHLGNHFVQDQLVALDPVSLAPLRRVLTASRSPRQDAAGGIDRGLSPLGIDVAPDGAWWIALAGSDEIARIAPIDPALRAIDVAEDALSAPTSVVVLAGGTLAIGSPSSGRIVLLDRATGAHRAIALAPSDAELLREDPDALQRRYGERAFYEGTRAGVSCQSCHLHGASDGLMHNIGGRVLVPTLDVRGVRGTSPYLRDGSYPRLRDLHDVADTLYRGYREPAGDRGATIEAWLASQPPPLPLAARHPEPERRGLGVFVRAGCPSCHAPPAMTNLGRHPTGSVFPSARAPAGATLDTPSLRAVSRRSRFLFDGRATTLAAIFLQGDEGDRHGRTRELGDRDLADLVRFLESL